jgi:hypothetical protein
VSERRLIHMLHVSEKPTTTKARISAISLTRSSHIGQR